MLGLIIGGVGLLALGTFYWMNQRGKEDAKKNDAKAEQLRQQRDVAAEHKATKVSASVGTSQVPAGDGG